MKNLFVAVGFVSLIACSPMVFVHDSKNSSDFARDKYDCKIIAEQSAANWGSRGNPFMIADEMRQCLQMKHGWRPQGGQG